MRLRAARGVVTIVGHGALAGVVACSALLGIGDRALDTSDGGGADVGPSRDAGGTADMTTVTGDETGTGEGAAEAGGLSDAGGEVTATFDGPGDARIREGGDGPASADSGCGDLMIDGHNCGRCQHDCLGGACSMGACQAVPLVAADAGVTPSGLAQDGQYLYWTDIIGGAVYRTDKGAGGKTLEWYTGANTFPQPIAVDDGGLYWGQFTGVWRCPKAGCGAGPTLVVASNNQDFVDSVAMDEGHLYWSDGYTGEVLSAPKTGTDAGGTTLWSGSLPDGAAPSGGAPKANRIATDGQRLYFTRSDGQLEVMGVDGGNQSTIGNPDPSQALGVSLQNGSVYWTVANPGQGAVWGAPTSSLAAIPIVVQQVYPRVVTTDGTSLYWITAPVSGNGQLLTCIIVGCSNPTVLASNIALGENVLVDDKAVYWTDYGNGSPPSIGSVWKIAR